MEFWRKLAMAESLPFQPVSGPGKALPQVMMFFRHTGVVLEIEYLVQKTEQWEIP